MTTWCSLLLWRAGGQPAGEGVRRFGFIGSPGPMVGAPEGAGPRQSSALRGALLPACTGLYWNSKTGKAGPPIVQSSDSRTNL
jgi:hypothetical protein